MSAKKKDSTVFWWIGWITLTILSFFVSCYFWTGFIAERVGPMSKPGIPFLWVSAVFGTWMILLVPLIVLMYTKVDKAYEDARLSKEAAAARQMKSDFGVKIAMTEESALLLPKNLSDKLKKIPTAVPKGHLVIATLKNGRRIENIFILNKKEILGVYGLDRLDFDPRDISDLEPVDLDHLPDFRTENWLRLYESE